MEPKNPLDTLEETIARLHKGVARLVGSAAPGAVEMVLGMEAKTQEARLKKAVTALFLISDLIPEEKVEVAQ
jgi:hypothetical protein